jgi:hypothetical protein
MTQAIEVKKDLDFLRKSKRELIELLIDFALAQDKMELTVFALHWTPRDLRKYLKG